jgi:hypothetical protein
MSSISRILAITVAATVLFANADRFAASKQSHAFDTRVQPMTSLEADSHSLVAGMREYVTFWLARS